MMRSSSGRTSLCAPSGKVQVGWPYDMKRLLVGMRRQRGTAGPPPARGGRERQPDERGNSWLQCATILRSVTTRKGFEVDRAYVTFPDTARSLRPTRALGLS